MTRISFDHQKCVRCRLCLRDCLGAVLQIDSDGYPVLTPEHEKYCIRCGHCFAICPQGAVVFNGRSGFDVPSNGALPEPEKMANLLRQRRSVRFYQPHNIAADKMEALKNILVWSPTGCNDHRLIFSIVEEKTVLDEIRLIVAERLKKLLKTGLLQLIFPPSKRYFSSIMNGTDVIFRGAPHLIAVSTPKNAPCVNWDAKIALSYFDTYAQALGLGTCWCGFAVYAFRLIPSLRKKLNLPKGYKIDAVMLFGEADVQYCRPTSPDPFRIDTIR